MILIHLEFTSSWLVFIMTCVHHDLCFIMTCVHHDLCSSWLVFIMTCVHHDLRSSWLVFIMTCVRRTNFYKNIIMVQLLWKYIYGLTSIKNIFFWWTHSFMFITVSCSSQFHVHHSFMFITVSCSSWICDNHEQLL